MPTRPRLIATLTVTALALTGCSRADTQDGNTPSPDDERVAAVGLGDADTLLALGVTPVAVAPWGAEGDNDPSGVGPWSKDLLGEDRPTTIYGTGTGFTAEILEEIAASDPTQIIAVNQAVDEPTLEALEKIAPTTTAPEEYADWQVPWEAQVEAIAEAVDKQKEGEELIDDTNAAFAEFAKKHPETKGTTAAAVMPYDGKIGLYTSGDGRGQFLEKLGFTLPAELEGDGSSFFRDLTPENYNELNNLDYLFVLDYQGSAEVLKKDETFQQLDIVKDGRVRYLDTDTGNAMSMPNPVTIPWAIDKFSAAL